MGLRSAQLYRDPSLTFEDPTTGLQQVSQPISSEPTAPQAKGDYSSMAKGATSAMNAGASPGGMVTSAGLYSMNPYMIGGGLALTAYEQKQKAEAAQEQARVEEAQQRKMAVQNALNQALGATRQLGV